MAITPDRRKQPPLSPVADLIFNRPGPQGQPADFAPTDARRGLESIIPPQVREVYDHAKDEVIDRADRIKGDMIGAGMDFVTRFQPVDDVISKVQGTFGSHGQQSVPTAPEPSAEPGLPADLLRTIMPGAGKQAVVYAPILDRRMKAAGLTTDEQQAAFLAQMAVETGQLGRFKENLRYTHLPVLRRAFRSLASDPNASVYLNNPDGLAIRQYSYKNGNRGPSDATRYIGRGPVQVTGRDNYRLAGYEDNPDAMLNPDDGVNGSLNWWKAKHLDTRSGAELNRTDFDALSHTVNPYLSFEDRWNYYQRALKALRSRRTKK